MIDGNAINELLENAVSGGALPGVGGRRRPQRDTV